jgi:hypothetical protein
MRLKKPNANPAPNPPTKPHGPEASFLSNHHPAAAPKRSAATIRHTAST